MISSNAHPFPLSGVVAFCGSRHGSPFPVSPVVAAVLSAGGSVRVGCASGVDAAVRSCCPSAVVLRVSSFPGPARARLAARTRAVVAGASALCVFPPAGGSLGPGSSLAVREALRRGLPSGAPVRVPQSLCPGRRCVWSGSPAGRGRPNLAFRSNKLVWL